MSTSGSDEEYSYPGPTLSFLIVGFHPFGPVSDNLALITRLIGLSLGSNMTAGPDVVT